MRKSTEKRNTSKDIAPSHCPPPCAATWWFCRQALLGALLLIIRIVPQLSFATVIDPVDSVPQAQNKSVSALNDPAGHGVVGSRARPKTLKSARKHKIGLPVAFFSRAATQKSPQTMKIEAWPNGSFRVPSAARNIQNCKTKKTGSWRRLSLGTPHPNHNKH